MNMKIGLAAATNLCTWFRRNQRVPVFHSPVKVNLGSGLAVAKGWMHVDGSLNALVAGWPPCLLKPVYQLTSVKNWFSYDEYVRILQEHQFVHHRLDYGVPFPSESVDYLYSSHMLEHLYHEDAKRLLADIHRVLKPTGRLRIAVPDLEHAVKLYQGGRKEEALSYFFVPSRATLYEQHHYMYDADLLSDCLDAVGFCEIERCGFREGQVPDIDILDNRPEETLFLEAVKP
jgi:predicted SAM-dependent methyltransferase